MMTSMGSHGRFACCSLLLCICRHFLSLYCPLLRDFHAKVRARVAPVIHQRYGSVVRLDAFHDN
jgi:hypothetical protein